MAVIVPESGMAAAGAPKFDAAAIVLELIVAAIAPKLEMEVIVLELVVAAIVPEFDTAAIVLSFVVAVIVPKLGMAAVPGWKVAAGAPEFGVATGALISGVMAEEPKTILAVEGPDE